MRKEYAADLWRRLVGLVESGHGLLQMQNPAIDFMCATKGGDLDQVSDEEYNARLMDVEDAATLWGDDRARTAETLLIQALKRTEISPHHRAQIADVLATASEATAYRTEEQQTTETESETIEAEPCSQYTPREIYDRLDCRIRGQEAAKRAAAMIVYTMLQGGRSNAVMCGPTGSGKTEIWRQIARWMPERVRIVDASRLSADGWKGSLHLRDVFENTQPQTGLIVVLDECDKICCETMIGTGGTDYAKIVQNSLLKLMDGDKIEFGKEDGKSGFSVDGSKVSVVMLGAFENLLQNKGSTTGRMGFGGNAKSECNYETIEITQEDMIEAGMRREIAGRVQRIVQLRPLVAEDYRDILPKTVIPDLQNEIKAQIEIDAESIEYLSKQAEASGLGVRWMISQVRCALDDLIFENPKCEKYTISISEKRDEPVEISSEQPPETQMYM